MSKKHTFSEWLEMKYKITPADAGMLRIPTYNSLKREFKKLKVKL